jgi:hypothetical protein
MGTSLYSAPHTEHTPDALLEEMDDGIVREEGRGGMNRVEVVVKFYGLKVSERPQCDEWS